jgi:hypothetical protein
MIQVLTLLDCDRRDSASSSKADKPTDAATAEAAAAGASGGDQVMSDSQATEKKDEKNAESKWAINRANILRYLAELVKFYPGCAHLVVRSHVSDPRESSKYNGQPFLGFAMHELLPVETGAANNSLAVELSRRTTALLLALFSRSGEARKRLLAEIVNIFMEDKNQGSMTQHLKIMQSLADVLLSVLTTKASVTGQGAPQPVPEVIKLMHESKVVDAICSALDSIDLHHPIAHKVSSSLLRPLDILCGSVQANGRGQATRNNAAGAAGRSDGRAHGDLGSMDMVDGADNEGHAAGRGSQEGANDDLLGSHHHDVETSLMIDLEEEHHADGRDGRSEMPELLPEDSVEMHEVSDGDDDHSDDSRESDDEDDSHGDEDGEEDNGSDIHDGEEDDGSSGDEEDEDDEHGHEVIHVCVYVCVCVLCVYTHTC